MGQAHGPTARRAAGEAVGEAVQVQGQGPSQAAAPQQAQKRPSIALAQPQSLG